MKKILILLLFLSGIGSGKVYAFEDLIELSPYLDEVFGVGDYVTSFHRQYTRDIPFTYNSAFTWDQVERNLRNRLEERNDLFESVILRKTSTGGVLVLELREHKSPNYSYVYIKGTRGAFFLYREPYGYDPDIHNPPAYNVSARETYNCPNMTREIFLDGFTWGATYHLKRDGEIIESKVADFDGFYGFYGEYGVGEYTITAQGDVSREMNGSVIVTDFPVLSSNFYVSPNTLNFPASGGTKSFQIIFNRPVSPEQRAQLQHIISIYNEGNITDWIYYRYTLWIGEVDGNSVTVYVRASYNMESSTFFSFVLRPIYGKIVQINQSGAPLLQYELSAPAFVEKGKSFAVSMKDFQPDVYYNVFVDGKYLYTQSGSKHFQGLTEFGEYSVYATYRNQTKEMLNRVRVRDARCNKNSMKVATYIDADTYIEDLFFYDGWGKQIQEVKCRASPLGRDVIINTDYTNEGQPQRAYLPYPVQSNASDYRPDYMTEQENYYREHFGSPEPVAYSEVRYDNSPAQKVVESSEPGYSWRMGGGHTTKYYDDFYAGWEDIQKFSFDGSCLRRIGVYNRDQLRYRETYDPEGNASREYVDEEGKLIAKGVITPQDIIVLTYYIYDEMGRERLTISPGQFHRLQEETDLEMLLEFCYYKEYDEYGRLSKQSVPGGGVNIFLYDKRHRQVLSQNSLQRESREWYFTKYDHFDRPVISGICRGTEAEHRMALANQTEFGEIRGGALHGYSNRTYPVNISGDDCLEVTYYDDYSWPSAAVVDFSQADTPPKLRNNDVVGLVTGTKTKVLDSEANQWLSKGFQWLLKGFYYDDQYQAIQTVSQLYPHGIEIAANSHDYIGNVTRIKVRQVEGNQTLGAYSRYRQYDERNRLLKEEMEVSGDEENGRVTLAKNHYDELGHLQVRKIHNETDSLYYRYNVRGDQISMSTREFFYVLMYDETELPYTYPRYDGFINSVIWGNKYRSSEAYIYDYDHLGQLTQALYRESDYGWQSPSGRFDVPEYRYDLDGNMTFVERKDADGNTLHRIDYRYNLPENPHAMSSILVNGISYDYEYNAIGNMTRDGWRGVDITYNKINLPLLLSGRGGDCFYAYSAAGEKLSMVESNIINYRGVMTYFDDDLLSIRHPYGTVRKNNNGYIYDYYIKDHTGNTRVVLEASGGLNPVQRTDYYPFGLPLGGYANLDKNKYLHSGKELQDYHLNVNMINLYDFGSRFYDPQTGRWFAQDPALQMISPYNYCNNNPVMFTDPDGEFTFKLLGPVSGFIKGIKGWFHGRSFFAPWKEAGKSFVNGLKIDAGLFKGKPEQILSRFTKELPQTLLGYNYSHARNVTWKVDQVKYFDGATYVINETTKRNGMSSGSYINVNIKGPYDKNKYEPEGKFTVVNDPMFMHEYGHYIQSQRMGFNYLFNVGIPSLFSAKNSKDIEANSRGRQVTTSSHDIADFEIDANRKAAGYFGRKYGVDWSHEKYSDYPTSSSIHPRTGKTSIDNSGYRPNGERKRVGGSRRITY